jgi:cytochrome c553
MLEGLPSWYVLAQLEKFRKGVRGKDPDNKSEWLMGSAIQQFSQTNAWSNLAQWISRQLYAACASCHGALGEGQAQLGGPPLNVQEDWYLREQMVKFKQGARGHHQADLGGIIMREAAQGLEKSDIDDLVAFLSHLRPKAQIQSENH